MSLTKVQKATLEKLKSGWRIKTNAAGYFWPDGKRVRYATAEALQKAGLVEVIEIQGKRSKLRFLVSKEEVRAQRIFDILVETCDANEYWRDNFVQAIVQGDCREYR